MKELQDEVARLRHELSRRSAAGSPTSSARGTTVVSSKSKDPSDSSEEEDEHPPVDDDEVRPLSLNRFCAWCQDKGEKITKDKQGRFYRNGKLMSESAIEQRLRRLHSHQEIGPCQVWRRRAEHVQGLGPATKADGNVQGSELEQGRVYLAPKTEPPLYMVQHAGLPWEAELKRVVTVKLQVEKSTARATNLKSGWYTERAMKEILKLSKS